MTQEEKSKAYDKVREKIKVRFGTNVAEEIFSEFEETEDERISKEIIKYLEQTVPHHHRDEVLKSKEWIAWLENIPYTIDHEKREGFHLGYKAALEKQGESYTKKDVDDAYVEGMAFAKNELEKQGEQKPNFCHHEVDLSDCSEEYRKAYYDGWNNCNMQHSQCKSELEDVAKCLINGMKFYYEDDEEATWGTDKWSMPVKYIIKVLEKQCEQKPADKVEPKFKVKYAGSEYNVLEIKEIAGVTYYGIEDEPNHIDYVLSDNCEIIGGYGIKGNGCSFPTKPTIFSEKKPKRMVSAEAKEAMYDKPACAWSEEDDDAAWMNDIISKVENNLQLNKAEIDWLKSLKERITWKPSEEQMDALNSARWNAPFKIEILDSLYNDLKKLTE